MPVRRMMRRIEELDSTAAGGAAVREPPPAKSGQASSTRSGRAIAPSVAARNPAHAIRASVQMAEVEALLRDDPVTHDDISAALTTTKPSSDGKIARCSSITSL